MRAPISRSAASLLLPAFLFAFIPWACGGGDDAEQSSTAAQATASSAGATSGSGGTGAAGSSGTAGAAGATGTGGTTSSGGPGSGGAGPGSGGGGPAGSTNASGTTGAGGGTPCTAGMSGCDPGYYCNAPGCGAGFCAPKPGLAQQQKDKALVCGCDGVTYWNESIAAYQGVGVQALGACPAGSGIACSQAMPCPSGLRCNRKATSIGTCTMTPNGECWGVPIACDPNGPQAHACSDMTCAAECTLIQSQNPWYGSC